MLEDLTIIDLTDERGIYGAKLLSDLGANVIRPEPRDGDPLRKRGPLRETKDPDLESLWYAFFASNRRFFRCPWKTRMSARLFDTRLVEPTLFFDATITLLSQ